MHQQEKERRAGEETVSAAREAELVAAELAQNPVSSPPTPTQQQNTGGFAGEKEMKEQREDDEGLANYKARGYTLDRPSLFTLGPKEQKQCCLVS